MTATASRTIKPNTVLPLGAVLLKRPVRKKLGGRVELTFDARVQRRGVTWYRAKGGFSDGDNSREDWVADLPAGSVSVSDYMWREPRWGLHEYGSFEEALDGSLKEYRDTMRLEVESLKKKLTEHERALTILQNY